MDIFGELSYSSHTIPPKAEYPRMKIKTKTTTRNASAVLDSLENVFEPDLHKQPKILREAACGRMLNHREEPQSMAVHFWNSGAPQFMVPMVPYFPKLIAACANAFDPTTYSINNSHLKVVIFPEAIRFMMCCPIFEGTEFFSESSIEEFWGTRRDTLTFCQSTLNRSLSSRLLKFPLSYSDLRQEDLKDISSTLSWRCGYDNDQDITTAMMRFLFKCRKQREPSHFDFSITMGRAIVKQLSEFQ